MRCASFLPAALLLLGSCALGNAATFTLTVGSDDISFSLPTSVPSPFHDSQALEFEQVATDVNGTPVAANILFYDTSLHGGLKLTVDGMNPFLLSQEGAQLFSGTTTNPTFLLNTFALTDRFGSDADAYSKDFSLTIAPETVATPEPSSLLLLETGLFSAVGMLGRRAVR